MDLRPIFTPAQAADGAVRHFIGSMLAFGVEAAVIRTTVGPVDLPAAEVCERSGRKPARRAHSSRYHLDRRPAALAIWEAG